MDVVYPNCAGLDVHKKTVVACVGVAGPKGAVTRTTRTFSTFTGQLQQLADWLASLGVTHVALESTGVYWKPVWHLLEGRFELLLVNPQHVKQVPGRKTDVKDAQWLQQLLQHGLLKGSCVPERWRRELRDLTRHRRQLAAERARVALRVQKTLEDANCKLAAVASDSLGVSGQQILRALIAGETDAGRLAELAKGKLRRKLPQLREALDGRLGEHHRFLLGLLLDHYAALEQQIAAVSARIEALTAPFAQALSLLQTIPGVQRRTAEVILAEVGPDMSRFPSAGHLCSWAGLCPGNRQSGGRRLPGGSGRGDRWLRDALCQASWAVSRAKGTYLGAQFARLAKSRGRKRAAVAIGHALLTIVYYMLKRGEPYRELGADYFQRRDPQRLTRQLVKRLEALGHRVVLHPKDAA